MGTLSPGAVLWVSGGSSDGSSEGPGLQSWGCDFELQTCSGSLKGSSPSYWSLLQGLGPSLEPAPLLLPQHFDKHLLSALNAFCPRRPQQYLFPAVNPDTCEGCCVATRGDAPNKSSQRLKRGHIQDRRVWGSVHWQSLHWPCPDLGLPIKYHSHSPNQRYDQ